MPSATACGRGDDLGVAVTEGAGQGAVGAQVSRESSRVDAHDGRDAVMAQEPLEWSDRTPVGGHVREFAHHHALAPRSQRLVVERRDAVVADVRIGEADDLTGVAGVGDDLLIARERGVEDELAAGEPRRRAGARRRSPRRSRRR